jgi:hypothetical protein
MRRGICYDARIVGFVVRAQGFAEWCYALVKHFIIDVCRLRISDTLITSAEYCGCAH